jgi:Flp pilus assembly pilin Flp
MKTFRQRKSQLGQGMTEYIIIVALMAVAAIGVYSYFGQTVRNQTAALATEVSGTDSQAEITAAGNTATQAQGQGNKQKTMSSFNGNGQ